MKTIEAAIVATAVAIVLAPVVGAVNHLLGFAAFVIAILVIVVRWLVAQR